VGQGSEDAARISVALRLLRPCLLEKQGQALGFSAIRRGLTNITRQHIPVAGAGGLVLQTLELDTPVASKGGRNRFPIDRERRPQPTKPLLSIGAGSGRSAPNGRRTRGTSRVIG
jgi:hypothetical protein